MFTNLGMSICDRLRQRYGNSQQFSKDCGKDFEYIQYIVNFIIEQAKHSIVISEVWSRGWWFNRIWIIFCLVTWCDSNFTLWSWDYSSKKCMMNWYLILSFECLANDHITRSDCASSKSRCNEISVFKKTEANIDGRFYQRSHTWSLRSIRNDHYFR